MSDVIRNAVIKLAIQLQSPDMKIPGIDAAIKQQQALAQATERANAVNQAAAKAQADAARNSELKAQTAAIEAQQTREAAAEAAKATQAAFNEAKAKLDAAHAADVKREAEEREARVSVAISTNLARIDAAYARAGIATIEFGKGLAYVAAGSSETLSKALPMLFAVEGITKAARSAAAMQTAFAAAMAAEAATAGAAAVATSRLTLASRALAATLNPLVVAAAATYAVWKTVTWAYDAATESSDELQKRLERERGITEGIVAANEAYAKSQEIIISARMQHIGLMDNETAKAQQLLAITTSAEFASSPEQQIQAGREALSLLDRQKQAYAEQKRSMVDLIRLRERELKTAQDALKTEQDRDQSLRAAVGSLNKGEQSKLNKLTTKLEAGGSLNQKEALDLQKLGGDAGQKLGEKFLATMDGGLGSRLEKLVGDPMKKAQEEYERRQQGLNKVTGGKSANAAVQSLNDLDEVFAKGIDVVKETISSKLDELIDAVAARKLEENRRQTAARAARAATEGR